MARSKTHVEVMEEAAAKVDKLPIWAQDYIYTLQRQAEQAEKRAEEATKGPDDSNVFRVWGLREDDQPIGKNTEIRFQMTDNYRDSISVRVDRQRNDGSLIVMGDRPVSIEPGATNYLRIRLLER